MSKPALLLLSFLPALALTGCFNPDYGKGGFLCSGTNAPCPEGYKCHEAEGICRKIGYKPPFKDLGEDSGKDPGKDSGPPPKDLLIGQCTAVEVVKDVSSSEMSWVLALDHASKLPRIFFLDRNGFMHVAVLKDNWNDQQIKLASTSQKADRLTGAVDSEGNSVLVFAEASNTSNPRPRVLWRKGDSGAWTGAMEVDAKFKVATEGLAMDTDGTNTFLAVTGKDTNVSSGKTALLAFFSWDAVKTSFVQVHSTYTSKEVSTHVRLAVGRNKVAYTGVIEKDRKWELMSFPVPISTAPGRWEELWKAMAKGVAPLNVAVTKLDGIYLAYGYVGSVTRKLKALTWSGKSEPPHGVMDWVNGSVQPMTMSITPSWKHNSVWMSMLHKVSSNESVSVLNAQGVSQPKFIDLSSSASATQIELSKDGIVHVVFDKELSGRRDLYYYSCQSDKL